MLALKSKSQGGGPAKKSRQEKSDGAASHGLGGACCDPLTVALPLSRLAEEIPERAEEPEPEAEDQPDDPVEDQSPEADAEPEPDEREEAEYPAGARPSCGEELGVGHDHADLDAHDDQVREQGDGPLPGEEIDALGDPLGGAGCAAASQPAGQPVHPAPRQHRGIEAERAEEPDHAAQHPLDHESAKAVEHDPEEQIHLGWALACFAAISSSSSPRQVTFSRMMLAPSVVRGWPRCSGTSRIVVSGVGVP